MKKSELRQMIKEEIRHIFLENEIIWFGTKYNIDKYLYKQIEDFGGIKKLRSAYDGKLTYNAQQKARDIVSRFKL